MKVAMISGTGTLGAKRAEETLVGGTQRLLEAGAAALGELGELWAATPGPTFEEWLRRG
jgi:hypothetical protein